MCGKNTFMRQKHDKAPGSPPRVREKRFISSSRRHLSRITPACAGKTLHVLPSHLFGWDHPRVGGKNSTLSVLLKKVLGSPPRVREKLSPTLAHSIKCRITPACAGKTEILTIHSTFKRDHPRVCGKNVVSTAGGNDGTGSPPRVREKPFSFTFLLFYRRITPACAGKTPVKFYRQCIDRDHPRVCGKNDQNDLIVSPRVGSPPRVREKHRMFHVDCLGQRITPACAGKTWSLPSCLSAIQDHPRVCGKNLGTSLTLIGTQGSPPRVREKPEEDFLIFATDRITPACAGKTQSNPTGAK